VGLVRFFGGALSPPSGLTFLEDLPSEEGLHLVAFGEGALEALKVAFREGARSLVLLSPVLRKDPFLAARLSALRFGLERGGVEGFARVGRALFFGPLSVGSEEIFAAWKEGLTEAGLYAWLELLEGLSDERRWLRGTEARVLVIQGALDAFTPPLYGKEVADFAKGRPSASPWRGRATWCPGRPLWRCGTWWRTSSWGRGLGPFPGARPVRPPHAGPSNTTPCWPKPAWGPRQKVPGEVTRHGGPEETGNKGM
jgi:hypothetical protein